MSINSFFFYIMTLSIISVMYLHMKCTFSKMNHYLKMYNFRYLFYLHVPAEVQVNPKFDSFLCYF